MDKFVVKRNSSREGFSNSEWVETIQIHEVVETEEERLAREERDTKLEYTNKVIFRNESFRPHQKVIVYCYFW